MQTQSLNSTTFGLPSQQSAEELQLLPGIPIALQLLFPHLRLPAQSESVSQSPPPTLHGLDDEQQDQPVDGIPSQFGATVVGTGGAVGTTPPIEQNIQS